MILQNKKIKNKNRKAKEKRKKSDLKNKYDYSSKILFPKYIFLRGYKFDS